MYTHFESVKVSQLTGPRTRRLQDRESDTGYDTRQRAPGGAFAHVSQTAVYDTGGSATPASPRRTASSRWTCSAVALQAAGIDAGYVYHDVASGVRDDRPGLDSCVRALRTGDVLVVWKLDRLGRTLAHLVNTVQDLSARGVGLRVRTGQGGADRHHPGGRAPRRQDLRAVESAGAAGPGREGAPRHLRVRALP